MSAHLDNSEAGRSTPGFFARVSVKARIYFGFGMLVVLSVGLAVFSVTQLGTIGTDVGRSTALTGNTIRVLEVGRLLESMRKDELRNQATWDDASVKTFGESQAEVLGLLTAAGKATLSEERRKTYAELSKQTEALSAEFGDLAKLTAGAKTDRATLFSVGDEVTAATNHLVEAAHASNDPQILGAAQGVESSVLLVRVANWRFLATSDPKGPATFLANSQKAAEAVKALEAMNPPTSVATLIGPVKAALANYAKSFEKVSGAMLAGTELYESKMRPRNEEMFKVLDGAKQSLEKDNTTAIENATTTVAGSTTIQEVVAAISFLIGILLAWLIGRSIVNPVTAMTAAMQKLAGGDTRAEIPARERGDEIGVMAGAVQVFKDNMIEADRLRSQQEELKHRAEAEKKAALNKMADEFEGSVKGVVNAVSSASTELQTSAQAMAATAEQTSRQSTAVAAASEQASTNVQTVASATEELTGSVAEITRQVAESSRICAEAVAEAAQTQQSMQGMAETAQKIGAVVTMINDIASQTNLLALNATIEAARAGDAGKGFAVVASEVKSLANQTAKATEEISAQIGAVQSASAASVKAIEGISATIGRVNEIATTIASAVEEQGAATKEIARNVQQAALGTNDVSSNIGGVSQAASETGSAASQVLSAAGELSKQSEMLRGQVDQFLATIRAA